MKEIIKIVKYTKISYTKKQSWCMVWVLLNTLLTLGYPGCISFVIDQGIAKGDLPTVIRGVSAILLFGVLIILTNYIYQIKSTKLGREAAKVSGADDFIEKLKNGYDTLLQKEWDNGSELSIGQWQKIAISRSVLRNSGILILDEPSSALDPKSEYEMFEKMKMLMRDKMSIMITHRFSNVRIVDQIFVMQEGKVVEFGSHEDLMLKKGIYYNLYSLQADYYK